MRAGRAAALLLVALLGCVRWEPIASAELGASGTSLALQRLRLSDAQGERELTVRRAVGGIVEGWDREGRSVRAELSAVRQAWLRRPNELLTAALVAGFYALIFTVSAAGLLTDRP